MEVSFDEAVRYVRDLNTDPGCNPEYERGQLELLGELFPVPDMGLGDRAQQLRLLVFPLIGEHEHLVVECPGIRMARKSDGLVVVELRDERGVRGYTLVKFPDAPNGGVSSRWESAGDHDAEGEGPTTWDTIWALYEQIREQDAAVS